MRGGGAAGMDAENALRCTCREDLHAWLAANHVTEPWCWVFCKRGKPPADGSLWYVDVVEEALCFGWIDSTLRRLPSGENAQKLMPRSPRSHWSELNKERCRRMERLGLMTDAGRAVIPDLDAHFVAEEEILAAMQADPVAWANFQAFPALYQRVRIDNIQGYRHSASERDRLIARLVQTAHDGVMYGQWDDYGRLG